MVYVLKQHLKHYQLNNLTHGARPKFPLAVQRICQKQISQLDLNVIWTRRKLSRSKQSERRDAFQGQGRAEEGRGREANRFTLHRLIISSQGSYVRGLSLKHGTMTIYQNGPTLHFHTHLLPRQLRGRRVWNDLMQLSCRQLSIFSWYPQGTAFLMSSLVHWIGASPVRLIIQVFEAGGVSDLLRTCLLPPA